MHFDFQSLPARDRYKLMVSLVVPRPIALVTSLNEDGSVNTAPFSFFNVIGEDPPLIMICPSHHETGQPKDTALNIKRTGEFVAHIVDEELAEAMNICAITFPHGESEVEAAGLELIPSLEVSSPRLAASPVAFECREHSRLEIGRNRLIIGEVLHLHVRDELIDVEKLHVRTENLRAIGRMHGGGWYAKTTDLFEIPRIPLDEWRKRHQ